MAGVVQDYLKTSERTVFWDDALRVNVDPFQGTPNGFFAAEWDLKVCLRVLFLCITLVSSTSLTESSLATAQNTAAARGTATLP